MTATPHPLRAPGRRRNRAFGIAAALVVTATTASAGYTALAGPERPEAQGAHEGPAPRVHDGTVTFSVRGGTATVDTASLRVTGRRDGGGRLPVSDAAADDLGAPGSVTVDGDEASWSYPGKGLRVTAASERGRLRMTVGASADRTLSWPVTGKGPGTDDGDALQIPRGEGLSVPVSDRFWNSGAAGLSGSEAELTGGLTMPLWGYTAGRDRGGVSYLVPEPVGTALGFSSHEGRLHATARHEFSRREETRDYTVTFSLTDASPVAPAADYRDWLTQHGRLRTLREKIAENPAVEKLLGAQHAYLWGGARDAKAVRALKRQGNGRLWLGYDADGDPMTEKAVTAARKAGYLVGPYDSFANGQDPETSDAPTSVWRGSVYPDHCIRTAGGKIKAGFHDRGCYLSSEAFAKAEPGEHHLAERSRKMTANGARSYFLDVDAAGELFTDHSRTHPMNKKQDRANRLDRMRKLASDDGLVLGSESAASWAAPVLAFNHGAQTSVADGLWPLERDKEKWGAYAPAGEPAFFFRPATLPDALAKAMYDPAYRVPLYETALHGSVINAERWELGYDKLPAQKTHRALAAMLYNTPLNFVLGDRNLQESGREMARMQRYFAPLHKAAGTEPMTGFRRLTDDHKVQRTVFGDGTLRVTANFGSEPYGSLPGGCVDAKLKNEREPQRLCPAQSGPARDR